jgi:L-malate glycosyltransferase
MSSAATPEIVSQRERPARAGPPRGRLGRDIRVLLIAPSPAIVGGQSVQAADLLAVLRGVPGLEMSFFPLDQRLPKPVRWISRIPFLRTGISLVLYCSRLLWAARRCDILHIFTAGLSSYSLWTIPALLIGKLYRKRLVVHYHDGQAEQHLTEWRTAKPTLALADSIVTPSEFLVDVFRKHGIEARSIFNIIDVSWFRYRKRRKLRPLFLSNRGLEPLYNVECTLRAFALIQQRYPDATLTVAHDGYHRPVLERLAKELQLRNTRFLGRVAHHQVAGLYDQVDIYLTSPNIDNMPVSLLECLASGLPIVATRAGGIPYIVKDGETALLVDIDDHEALASRAMELLENEDLVEHLTSRGLQEVQRYHWAPIREQWAELYRELMAPALVSEGSGRRNLAS